MNAKQARAALNTLRELFAGDAAADEALDILGEKLSACHWPENVSEELPIPAGIGEGEYVLFTDGACRGNPGPGAWGALAQDHRGETLFSEGGVEENTTNNRMELTGAIQALALLAGREGVRAGGRISLFSDSKYVVDGILSWVPGWKARGWRKADKTAPQNLDLWQALDEKVAFFGRGRVHFRWVKAHAGHPQNEYVDGLANRLLDEAGF